MQHLEVSGVVRLIYMSLGVKGLIWEFRFWFTAMTYSSLNSIVHLTGASWLSARHEIQVGRGLIKHFTPWYPSAPVFHLIDWATD